MTENIIRVPRTLILEGKEFYANTVAQALTDCQVEHDAQFMPEFLDTRIFSDKDARVWQTWFLTPSIRATIRTMRGTPIVAYAHISNHFSNPQNIAQAVQEGLINGAGKLPKDERQRILDLEGNNKVHVVDHATLMLWPSDVYGIDEPTKEHMKEYHGKIAGVDMIAINHPQTVPFIGEESRARQYLVKHKDVFGPVIGIWHSDDLQTDDVAVARPLYAGSCNDGLGGCNRLNYGGRFLGVRRGAGEASTPKVSPDRLAEIIAEYVASRNQQEVRDRVSAMLR